MIKFLIYLSLAIGFQLANAQSNTTYYKVDGEKIVTQEQLDKKIEMFKKLAKQVSEKAEFKIIYSDTLVRKDSTIVSVAFDLKGEGISMTSNKKSKVEEELLGKPFPEFNLNNLANETVNLKQYEDKPLMINFWFKNCPPCIDEMPALNKLQEKYKDQVHFVSITFNEADEVNTFLAKNEFNFEHLVDAQEFCDQLGIENYPQNIFLDSSGKVAAIEGGIPYMMNENGNMTPGDESYFEEIIKKLL